MKTEAVICYYLKDKKTLNLCGERNNTKKQRILRYEKTGFWVVGNKKEPFEKDS
jgi:hypothetical protein